MTRDDVINAYFAWMCDLVADEEHADYRKLLMYLHTVPFRYSVAHDDNRASDGVDLRYRFVEVLDHDYYVSYLNESPCSVLEMMVALAVRCEEQIMDNPDSGNRTSYWFWGMIDNLGLFTETDNRFDKSYASGIVNRFLNRTYDADGTGGLFTVKHCSWDLRNVEIWYQMCWYLDEILDI
jgi:hypothetical protein